VRQPRLEPKLLEAEAFARQRGARQNEGDEKAGEDEGHRAAHGSRSFRKSPLIIAEALDSGIGKSRGKHFGFRNADFGFSRRIPLVHRSLSEKPNR